MPTVTPIGELSGGRPQEAGKIKVGAKAARGRPTSLDTFRFVSRDHIAVARLAEVFGGTVQLVDGQSDLISDASEIDVILPPDPLGGTPIYELWSGGGCQRRCDGVTATVPIRQGDDVAFVDQECLCSRNDLMECKPTVRLSVILPQVHLGGVWNLKTNSWAAAREMQQMVSMVELAQQRGLTAASLGIEARSQTTAGRTRNFKVPVLKLKATLAELAAGGAMPVLAAPSTAALPSAPLELTEDQRATLGRVWKAATPEMHAEVKELLKARGVEQVTQRELPEVLDLLVVHEPDPE